MKLAKAISLFVLFGLCLATAVLFLHSRHGHSSLQVADWDCQKIRLGDRDQYWSLSRPGKSACRGLTSQHEHTLQGFARDGRLPGREDLCIKNAVLALVEPKSLKGFMKYEDLGAELESLSLKPKEVVTVRVDGFPCAKKGCCQHDMRIRHGTTDLEVLRTSVSEFAEILEANLPWTPEAILEGGGNIGVATSLLAFMYPDAKIVTLEPDPENCELVQQNTQAFSNVVVECKGLYTVANVSVVLTRPDSLMPWGFSIREGFDTKSEPIWTTSITDLLQRHGLGSFDVMKMDIEWAEFGGFKAAEELAWLPATRLIIMEVHGNNGQQLVEGMEARGLISVESGEYIFFLNPALMAEYRNVKSSQLGL